MGYEGYIAKGYEPDENDLVVEFFIEPAEGLSLERAAEITAGESSVGTWTDIATMSREIADELGPKVFDVNKGTVKIAYPSALFEEGNIPQVMSSIAGNIFGMKAVKNLRLVDVRFPDNIVKSFKGPEFGISGIRKLLKVKERPLIGTIVKPKVGLDPDGHAKVSYESWVGGLDIVKDDENLSSQKFNPFEERITKTLELRDKAESETGEKKIYMPNITAETNEMLRRAEFVKEHGCEYMMVDVLTVGFSALQTVRDANLGLVIHAHRAMHGALTRNRKHGISMLALARIFRLIGVDQLHIGTAVGKMQGPAKEVVAIKDAIIEDWSGLKKTFPVASGGLHPGMIPELVKILGKDIIIQAGGGVHGHPDGSSAGATAMRQAVDAAMEGVSLEDYAKDHPELGKALGKWSK